MRLEKMSKPIKLINYSEALKQLSLGNKVSATRWGTEGKVFVSLEHIEHKFSGDLGIKVLVLVDTNRNKAVAFTPSVENQFEDEWYLV